MRTLSGLSLGMILVPVFATAADGHRELGAHEHGSGNLNIAVEGTSVALELEAPGADIVGFEYAAKSADDRAAIDAAIARLAQPLELFLVPSEAACTVVDARVALIGEDEEDHAHDEEHADDEHDHDEEHAHDDERGHDEEHAHDDEHGHDEEHAHDDEHGHDDEHAEAEASHTEFHAEYLLTCAEPGQINQIEFAYFAEFPNALELEVQLVSDVGAQVFEVERDNPVLDMRGLF